MDRKYIQGTPEYREYITSMYPPGFDLSQLGIEGLVDDADDVPRKLFSYEEVFMNSDGVLMGGVVTRDGWLYANTEATLYAVDMKAKPMQTIDLVTSPMDDFGNTAPLKFRKLALIKDDTLIVSAGWEGDVRAYDRGGTLVSEVKVNDGIPLTGIVACEDGVHVLVCSTSSNIDKVNALTGEVVWTCEEAHGGEWLYCIALGAPGQFLTGSCDGNMEVRDVATGELFKRVPIAGGGADVTVTCIQAVPDGRIAVGCENGAFLVLSGSTFTPEKKMGVADDSEVLHVAFSSDMSTMTTSADEIKVWRLEDFTLLKELDAGGYVCFHAIAGESLISLGAQSARVHKFSSFASFAATPALGPDAAAEAEAARELCGTVAEEVAALEALPPRAAAIVTAMEQDPPTDDSGVLERLVLDTASRDAAALAASVAAAAAEAREAIAGVEEAAAAFRSAEALEGEALIKAKLALYKGDSSKHDRAAAGVRKAIAAAKATVSAALSGARVTLASLEEAPSKRERAKNGTAASRAKVKERALRLEGLSSGALPPLSEGCKWHFFISHYQTNSQDQCMALKQSMVEVHPELQVWISTENSPTEVGMREGILKSETFLLFLSKDVLTREWCLFEIRTAMAAGKPIVMVHEPDARHGGAPMWEIINQAPPDVNSIFDEATAITYHREKEFRRVMVAKILREGGLPVPWELPPPAAAPAVPSTAAAAPAAAAAAPAAAPAPTAPPPLEAAAPAAGAGTGAGGAGDASILALGREVARLKGEVDGMQSHGGGAGQEAGAAALSQRVQALESRVEEEARAREALEEKVAQLQEVAARPQPQSAGMGPVADAARVEALEEKVAQLQEVAARPQPQSAGMGPVADAARVEALEEKVAQLQEVAARPQPQSAGMGPVADAARVEALEKKVAQLQEVAARPQPQSSSCTIM